MKSIFCEWTLQYRSNYEYTYKPTISLVAKELGQQTDFLLALPWPSSGSCLILLSLETWDHDKCTKEIIHKCL